MAISDKVIDLAPVNKTKNLILYITLGVLGALSVVFIILYAIKPNVTPIQVNSVTITAHDLYDAGGGELTASYMCAYSLEAEVGVMGDADTTLSWEFSPQGTLYNLDEKTSAEEELPTAGATVDTEDGGHIVRSYFNFRVISMPDKPVTVIARSNGDGSKVAEFTFKVVEGVTGSVKLQEIAGTDGREKVALVSEGDNVYSLSAPLPYYKKGIGYNLKASNSYSLSVEQLGLGGVAQITSGTVSGTSNSYDTLKAESSNASVVSINGGTATAEKVDFTVNGLGEAELTVTANAYNTGEELSVKLKIKTVSTDSRDIISRYYLYPDGNVPSKAPNYEELDIKQNKTSVTLYLGDNFVLEDHLLVRPWSRMADFAKKIQIRSSDSSVVREGDVGGKKALTTTKAGRADVAIKDTSAGGAEASLTISVEVRIRVKSIAVTSPVSSSQDNRYSMAAFRSQSGGKIELAYNFDANEATFENTYTDCNLTVYRIVDGVVSEKPYLDDGGVSFKSKDGVIAVPNTTFDKAKAMVTGSIGFTVTADAALGAHKFRFVSGAAPNNGGKNWFDVEFVVTIEPKGLLWKQQITPGTGIAQFLSIEANGNNATLTVNLGTPENQSVSVADLLQFADSEGNLAVGAFDIGIGRIKVRAEGPSYTTPGTIGSPSNKIVPKSVNNGSSSDKITVYLYENENKTGTPLATSVLYIRVVDNDKRAVLGNESNNEFTEFASIVEQRYESNTTLPYDQQTIALDSSGFGVYRQTWSGSYSKIQPSAYKVRIKLKNSTEYLFERTLGGEVYYYAEEPQNDDPTQALFKLSGGKVYILRDLFIAKNVYGGEDHSEFSVHYFLTGIEDETGGEAEYSMRRTIQTLKLYTDSSYATPETADGSSYDLVRNQGDTLYLYVGGGFTYNDGTGEQTKVMRLGEIAQQTGVLAVELTNKTDAIIAEQISDTQFKLITGIASGGQQEGSFNFSVRDQQLNIIVNVTVQNKSAPVESIKLYTVDSNGAKQNEFKPGEADRYLLDSARSLTLYYEIAYKAGEGFISYETVNFLLKNLQIDLKDGAAALAAFTPAGTPDGSAYTATGHFIVTATGDKNGAAEWTLVPSSNKAPVTCYFTVTTYMTADNAVEMTAGADTFYSGSPAYDGLTFTMKTASDKPQQSLGFRLVSATSFPVDKGNYTFSFDGKNLLTAVHSMETGKITLTATGKTGTDTVTLTFTEAVSNKTYVVNIVVTVEADVYSLELTHGGAPVNTVALESLGEGTATENSYGFGIRFNGGNADRQPKATLADVVFTLEKDGVVAADGALTLDTAGHRIVFSNTLYTLSGNYTLKAVCGEKTLTVPITLSTKGHTVKFAAASADVFHAGEYTFAASVYKANDLSNPVAVPDGYTLRYSVSAENGAATALATVDPVTGKVTVTGASGSFQLTAKLYSGYGTDQEVLRGAASMRIDINNLVYYIVNTAAFPNSINGNGEIWMAKGKTLDLTGYIGLKSYTHGTPYTGADYTAASSDVTGLSVTQKTLTAVRAGSYTITLTADNGGKGTPVVRTFTVCVVEPVVTVADASLNAVDKTALTETVTVTGLGAATGAGSLTVTETTPIGLFDIAVDGLKVTLTLKNAAALDLTTDKTASFTATYTLDGKTFTDAFDVTVTASGYVPTFTLLLKTDAATYVQFNGDPDRNDTYKFSGNEDSRVTSVTYAAKYGSGTYGTIDPVDYRFTATGTVRVRAQAVLFGKTFESAEAQYTVVDRAGLTAKFYAQRAGDTFSQPVTAVDGFYATGNTPKTVYVVIDASDANYTFTAADFVLETQSAALSKSAAEYIASTRQYVETYRVVGAGQAVFYAKALINGSYSQLSPITLTVTQPDAGITVDYKKGAVAPGSQLDLSDANVLAISKKNVDVTTQPNYTYEVIAGAKYVESLGGSLLTLQTCLPAGGTVTVRVTASYTDGWFAGTSVTADFSLTVTTVAAPTISLAESSAKVDLAYGTNSYTITQLPTVTQATGDSVGTVKFTFESSNTDVAVVSADGTVTLKVFTGVRFYVTATTVVAQGAWKGLELSKVYTFSAMPDITFEGGSVTPGETVDLNDLVGLAGYTAAGADPVFTAVYTGSNDAVATVVNNGLTAKWGTDGTVTVTAKITLTRGELTGYTFEKTATFDVLGLVLRDEGGNPVTSVNVRSGQSAPVTVHAGGSAVTDTAVFESSDTALVTADKNGVKVASAANIEQDGVTGAEKRAVVSISYTAADGKIYKARLTVVIPVTPKPSPVVAVKQDDVTISGSDKTYTASVSQGNSITLTLDADLTNQYAIADYTAPFAESQDNNLFSYGVKQEGSKFTLTVTALSVTAEKTVTVKYTVKGYTYTAAVLKLTVTQPVDAGTASVSNSVYGSAGSKQLTVGNSYEYTFTVSGTFRYLNFKYDESIIQVNSIITKRGSTDVGSSASNYRGGNGDGNLFYSVEGYSSYANSCTFRVTALASGAPKLQVIAGSSWSSDYYSGYYIPESNAVKATAELTVIQSGAFTADSIEVTDKQARVDETVGIYPTLAAPFAIDSVSFRKVSGDATVDSNGNVSQTGYGDSVIEVTVRSAGTTASKNVTVSFLSAPVVASFTYDASGQPTLSMTQDGAQFTKYTVSYSANTNAFGTLDTSTGVFTAKPVAFAGTVRVTAAITVNAGLYNGTVLTVYADIAVDKAAEPTLTASVTNGRVTISGADFTVVSFASDNPEVAVDADGDLTNLSLNAQQVTVTVVARYSKAGSPYDTRLYTATVTHTLAAAADEQPLTASISGNGDAGTVIANSDDRLTELGTVTYKFALVNSADSTVLTLDASTGAYTAVRGNVARSVSVKVSVLINGTEHANTTVVIDVPAQEPAFTASDVRVDGAAADYTRSVSVTTWFTLLSMTCADAGVAVEGGTLRNTTTAPKTVAVTVYVVYTGEGEYNGKVYTVSMTVTLGVEPQPALTLAVTAGTASVSLAGEGTFTVTGYTSSNADVTVSADGVIANKTLSQIQCDISATVVYHNARSAYDGKTFTVNREGVTVAADAEKPFTAQVDAAADKITYEYDARLVGALVSFALENAADAAYLTLNSNGTYTPIPGATAVDVPVLVTLSVNGTARTPVKVIVSVPAAEPVFAAADVAVAGADADYMRAVTLNGDYALIGLWTADADVIIRGNTLRNAGTAAKTVTVRVTARFTGVGDYRNTEYTLEIAVKLGVEAEPVLTAQLVGGKIVLPDNCSATYTTTKGVHIADDGTVTLVGSEIETEIMSVVVNTVYTVADSRFANRSASTEFTFEIAAFTVDHRALDQEVVFTFGGVTTEQTFTFTSSDPSKLTLTGGAATGYTYTYAWTDASQVGDKIVLTATLTYTLTNGVTGDWTATLRIEKPPVFTATLTNGTFTLPADFTFLSVTADHGTASYTDDKLKLDVGDHTGVVTLTVRGSYNKQGSMYDTIIEKTTVTVTIPAKSVDTTDGAITVAGATITDVTTSGAASKVTVSQSAGVWSYAWTAGAVSGDTETLTVAVTYEIDGVAVTAQRTTVVGYSTT